jgi:hypothetical protein
VGGLHKGAVGPSGPARSRPADRPAPSRWCRQPRLRNSPTTHPGVSLWSNVTLARVELPRCQAYHSRRIPELRNHPAQGVRNRRCRDGYRGGRFAARGEVGSPWVVVVFVGGAMAVVRSLAVVASVRGRFVALGGFGLYSWRFGARRGGVARSGAQRSEHDAEHAPHARRAYRRDGGVADASPLPPSIRGHGSAGETVAGPPEPRRRRSQRPTSDVAIRALVSPCAYPVKAPRGRLTARLGLIRYCRYVNRVWAASIRLCSAGNACSRRRCRR